MKKIMRILVIGAGVILACGCTRQAREQISGQTTNRITMEIKRQEYGGLAETETKIAGVLTKAGQRTRNGVTDAYAGMFSDYIADGRYLISYWNKDIRRMGVYDLDTLENGIFHDYVIRYEDSFRFKRSMKDIFLMLAMSDTSFRDKPWFTYYDEEGKPQLELYFNSEGIGCGICYDGTYEGSSAEIRGFRFRKYEEEAWEESAYLKYYELSEYFDGIDEYKKEMNHYEEAYTYNDAGQITEFYARGETKMFTDEWEPISVAGCTCEYNEDGILRKQSLFRHPLLFGTSASTASLYYDEKGRIVYMRLYITHGSLEHYFIYRDDGDIPACSIMIDHYSDLIDAVFCLHGDLIYTTK